MCENFWIPMFPNFSNWQMICFRINSNKSYETWIFFQILEVALKEFAKPQ